MIWEHEKTEGIAGIKMLASDLIELAEYRASVPNAIIAMFCAIHQIIHRHGVTESEETTYILKAEKLLKEMYTDQDLDN